MKLERNIIWWDSETTGTDVENDRICQIACTKIKIDGTRETKETLINPEIPIPKEATEVHGITDEMVKDAPTFKQLAVSMRSWFDGCDLGTYNGNSFDNVLISAEFVRAGLDPINWSPALWDALVLYRTLFPNTLGEVYKRLTGKELINSHSALADTTATLEIAEILLPLLKEQNPDVEFNTVKDIDLFLQGDRKRIDLAGKLYKDSDGVVKYAFGKDKDKSVKDNPGFGKWMMSNSFPTETKNKLKEILNGTK